jgi:hypothetical protein
MSQGAIDHNALASLAKCWHSSGEVLKERNDLETSVLVGQIRSTAIDLLQAAGMGSDEAPEALREVSRLGRATGSGIAGAPCW